MSSPIKHFVAISQSIAWFQTNSKGVTVEQLLNLQNYLAAQSYFLAEICADFKQDYNQKYFIKKSEVLRSKQNLLTKGSPIGKAETTANFEHLAKLKAELESEALAYKADLLLKQVNQVLAAIAQKISYLKLEKLKTKA